MSILPHGKSRLPRHGFSRNFLFDYFFENLSRKFKVNYNLTRITDALHEYRHMFTTIRRSILLRMIHDSKTNCRQNQNTHFRFDNIFFFEILATYEIACQNVVDPNRPQMTIWRMRVTSWISKSRNTHTHTHTNTHTHTHTQNT